MTAKENNSDNFVIRALQYKAFVAIRAESEADHTALSACPEGNILS
jgi:hypothetical protein